MATLLGALPMRSARRRRRSPAAAGLAVVGGLIVSQIITLYLNTGVLYVHGHGG